MGLFDGSNSTTSTSVPDWAQPYYQGYLGRAQEVADIPYQPYTGDRTAGLTDWQQQALQAQAQRAMQGNSAMTTAQGALQQTAGGDFLGTQAAQNPFLSAFNQHAGAQNPYLTAYNQNAGVANPMANVANPYASGSNPYLGQNIEAAMQDTIKGYQMGVVPQMDAIAARSGSFGNSGVQQMQTEQQRQFGNTLGNIASGMRGADYTQRAQLAENQAGRLFQAGAQQQQNLFSAGQQQANQMFQGGAQQQQNLYGAGQQLAQNQFAGGQAGAAAQNAMFDAERARQMQALGLAPTYAANDYVDASKLYAAGAPLQGLQQANLDTQYQQYLDALGYPRQQLQTLGQALGANYGQTTTTNPGSPSMASNMLSSALLGNVLFGGQGGGLLGGLFGG